MATPARLLRCPKCSATVSVASGAKPSCLSCGYGAATSSIPTAAASATQAPIPYPNPSYQGPGLSYPVPQKSAATIGWLAVTLSILVPLSALLGVISAFLAADTIVFERTAAGVQSHSNGGGLGGLGTIVGIACVVFGLIWVGKLVSIARARTGVPMSPGWAVCSWIIPVGHIVTPYFPLGKAWRAARAGSTALFAGWAVAYGGALLLSYVVTIWSFVEGFRAGYGLPVGESVVYHVSTGAMILSYVSTGLTVVAGALFLVILWRFQNALGGREARPN